ncbi:MAG TPA: F0F1 ATP synthase subunit B [Candidatus Saccharimonadales bacterium]|nr:F0F1 ATP synthase subunit B [Candidatus Saccharimonadales bacterium]
MTNILTRFGADATGSGIGALGVDGKALVIQLVTFGLAYLVLRRYAFGPIMRVMQERRDTIEKGVKLGEQMQKQQVELDAKVQKALADARAQADGILAGANEEARATVGEAEDKARTKADGILAEAESRIAQDTARARQKLEKELVGLISDATEAIIDEKVDATKDAALIDKALKESARA